MGPQLGVEPCLIQKKASQQMETYALEIQMHTARKDTKNCRRVYMQTLNITSSITHPSIVGTIKECGGKMYMQDREFSKANSDFFEAFKAFDEAGSPSRIRCLKYVFHGFGPTVPLSLLLL